MYSKIPMSMNGVLKLNRLKKLLSLTAIGLSSFWLILAVALPSGALAAGDASFGLSSSSYGYNVGSTIVLSISENSLSTDNVNAVQINLSYPVSELQYDTTVLSGPFTLCAGNTGGGGSVSIGCASTTPSSGGPVAVANVTFTAVSAGSPSVNIVSGSDIDSTGGNSVYDGSPQGVSYTITTPPVSSGSSASSSSGASTSSPSSAAAPTTTTTTPTPTNLTANLDQVGGNLGSVSVTVTNVTGQDLNGIKVKLSDGKTSYTGSNGVATFQNVSGGNYTVTVIKPGEKPLNYGISLGSGEDKLVSFKLAYEKSSLGLLYGLIALVVAIILISAATTWYFKFHRAKKSKAAKNQVVAAEPSPKTEEPLAISTQPPVQPAKKVGETVRLAKPTVNLSQRIQG
jgi:hypothetical protein